MHTLRNTKLSTRAANCVFWYLIRQKSFFYNFGLGLEHEAARDYDLDSLRISKSNLKAIPGCGKKSIDEIRFYLFDIHK